MAEQNPISKDKVQEKFEENIWDDNFGYGVLRVSVGMNHVEVYIDCNTSMGSKLIPEPFEYAWHSYDMNTNVVVFNSRISNLGNEYRIDADDYVSQTGYNTVQE